MKNVLVLGGISYNMMVHVDEFPKPVAQTIHSVQSFHETLGSTGCGKALNLKKLGFDVKLYGVIGQDPHGELIKARLKQEGIPFTYDVSPTGTERHLNLMKNSTGERLSIFLNPSQMTVDINTEAVESLIQESDVVFLNIISYCKEFIPLIQKYNKEIWVDLHDYDGENEYHQPFIDAAHVIQFSSENNPNYRKTMEEMISSGKKLVICTHGSKGSTTLSEHGWLETSALQYDVKDTNGAGDAFFSGILYGLSKGYDLEQTVKTGTIVGGTAVTSLELASENLTEQLVEEEYKKW